MVPPASKDILNKIRGKASCPLSATRKETRFCNARQSDCKYGMVHVIASEAYDASHRRPRLDGAWRLVKRDLGEDIAQGLPIDNPSAIFRGGVAGRKPAAARTLGRTEARRA
jgi:hypothetical protein